MAKRSSAKTFKSNWRSRFRSYLRSHPEVARDSLKELIGTPFATFMTLVVLGIAISLPAGLQIFLKNIEHISQQWQGNAQISVFFKGDVSEQQQLSLLHDFQARVEFDDVAFITAEQALEEFKELSGFGEALDYLDQNPLPAAVILKPGQAYRSPEKLEALAQEINAMNAVDLAQLDMQWVRRLQSMMILGGRAVAALSLFLSLAVLMIVGNTIRLTIENHREEIEIIKLVGATDGFVRRPFIYSGVWLGLLSGGVAWVLIRFTLGWLDGPVRQLAGLYGSQFELIGLSFSESMQLLLLGLLLGLAGSWLAVGRHIRDIEPQI
ncbi:MAG: cell division protein FtsX [Kangiellaceae bacterium]|nr:cell division protein FtsX [Kangiellaceae bacterium]